MIRHNRGDIINVFFDLPFIGDNDLHPAIIISNDSVYEHDKMYICVMMTSNARKDRFSFEIKDEMLVKPNNKKDSQARCHIVMTISEQHINDVKAKNTMKSPSVDRLVARINSVSLED